MASGHDSSSGIRSALVGTLLLATASTLGDAIWAAWIPRHRALYGLIHGTALFLVFGLYLGLLGRTRRSFVVGPLGAAAAGLAAAGSFYVLRPLLRVSAMFAAWVFLWIVLGLVTRVVLRSGESWARATARGVAAALSSGVAFYAISGIWLRPAPGGPNYPYHFLCWNLAYLPAFLALLVGQPRAGGTIPQETGAGPTIL